MGLASASVDNKGVGGS
ncbi:hypothetical protein E2C01_094594 [Portunus trituberculatus]|uniref:Uncharacterized protein n=1 Tax=Portunus trituberculatus TaxID=210409 RepID=A0A5B7JXA4_PORTR|nr:hypothetical protein [Portunus trituberculatus]